MQFFMYLYQDLNRRPTTIDGYRIAIGGTFGPVGLHISQTSDLNRLLSSFHRDRPKSSRNLPKWNLSVVLNELTKAPFEPMKDTDLKHLTLKIAFLLALASGKRRSEIHALRYYLDRTKDLRESRSLLFISFKKGHTSDIRPATLSSWLTQTILIGYEQADQQALLKHMSLRPLRPLRPFTVGYRWTKSCKLVTGKLTTHLQIFTQKILLGQTRTTICIWVQ